MRVVIVGGGVIGCAIAERLGRDGHRVHLLERDTIGSKASGAAAGLLAPHSESGPEGFSVLASRSAALFPGLATRLEAETGIDVQYREGDSLRLAFGDEEAAPLRQSPHWLDPAECRRLEPGLGPDVAGGLRFREAQVTPPRLVQALARLAVRQGAVISEHTPALGFLGHVGRVEAVQLMDATIEADRFVLAAGPWSREVATGLELEIPVTPVRGQLVSLTPIRGGPGRILTWGSRYIVPKPDGNVVAGSTEDHAGFDADPTPEGTADLLGFCARAYPELGAAVLERAWAALRPATPDGRPIIRPAAPGSNLLIATGHHRNGILLAPVTAELIAEIVSEARDSIELR